MTMRLLVLLPILVWILLSINVAFKYRKTHPGTTGLLAFCALMFFGFFLSWGVVPLIVGVIGIIDGKSGGYLWALIIGALWTIFVVRQIFSEYLIPGLKGELDF